MQYSTKCFLIHYPNGLKRPATRYATTPFAKKRSTTSGCCPADNKLGAAAEEEGPRKGMGNPKKKYCDQTVS